MGRSAVVVSMGVLLASCQLGHDPARHPSARRPEGTDVVVERLRRPPVVLTHGELLAVTDSGIILKVARPQVDDEGVRSERFRLVLAPYGLPFLFRFVGASGRETVRRPATRAEFRTAQTVARHPFGLTPEQLGQLLALRGQNRLDVLDATGVIR